MWFPHNTLQLYGATNIDPIEDTLGVFDKDELEVMSSNTTTRTKKKTVVVATDSDNNNSDAETEATQNDSDATDNAS